VWQLKRACDRQGFEVSHPLRNLPWFDLQKEVFLAEPIGVPGAWGYGIKEVAPALGLLQWPGDLDDGLRASVAGWKSYESSRPLESSHMQIVVQYNEVDCRALHELVKWLRRSA
jgi:predicted RecB family nuclease